MSAVKLSVPIFMFYCFLFLTIFQKERKKKWDEKNQEEIAKAVKYLDEFDQVVELVLSLSSYNLFFLFP